MKSAPAAWLIAFFAIAVPLSLRGQAPLEHAPSLPSQMGSAGSTQELASTAKNTTGASASATPDQESTTAEHDDSLYRGKTSDSENPMLRDEGALHFKTHPKERVKEVDSLKSLQSSGTDPKFQGSFITSGTSSIDSVAAKAYEPPAASVPQEEKAQGDTRFKRHMTFAAPEEEKTAKAGADSSPSPSPSPSASPAKKKSTDAKR
ncbi:MAG TPA: hypothetical protein VIU85_06185 [Chthoniobacterales bacterium]